MYRKKKRESGKRNPWGVGGGQKKATKPGLFTPTNGAPRRGSSLSIGGSNNLIKRFIFHVKSQVKKGKKRDKDQRTRKGRQQFWGWDDPI